MSDHPGGDEPERIDLGMRIPAVRLPSDAWCCAIALTETLRLVWRVVLDCWATGHGANLQIVLAIPPRRGPIVCRDMHVLPPPLRLVEKALDNHKLGA